MILWHGHVTMSMNTIQFIPDATPWSTEEMFPLSRPSVLVEIIFCGYGKQASYFMSSGLYV